MAGVFKQTLDSLTTSSKNSLIVGVIISNSNMREFESRNSWFHTGTRGVWSFTFRDSQKDFTNVTVWGSADYIRGLTARFHIGDVVEIVNGKAVERRPNDRNEEFSPSISCPFALTLNEGTSLIEKYDAPNRGEYLKLLALPTKSVQRVMPLKVVLENVDGMTDQYVDLLVLVVFLSDIREMVTRNGKSQACRDFEVMDESSEAHVRLRLWEVDWVHRSAAWKPRETVLFLADVRIALNPFKKRNVPLLARKTLITENPTIPQTEQLRTLIASRPENSLDNAADLINPENIKTVMTIEQIIQRLDQRDENLDESVREQFATIVFAVVTDMNADNSEPGLIVTRCSRCKRMVPPSQDSCMNLDCPFGNGTRAPENVRTFNLRLNLKDDTGYLIGCKATGKPAEELLGCDPEEFEAMSVEDRQKIKWRFLMEKCDVRLRVLGPSSNWPRPLYQIMSIRALRGPSTEEESHSDSL